MFGATKDLRSSSWKSYAHLPTNLRVFMWQQWCSSPLVYCIRSHLDATPNNRPMAGPTAAVCKRSEKYAKAWWEARVLGPEC